MIFSLGSQHSICLYAATAPTLGRMASITIVKMKGPRRGPPFHTRLDYLGIHPLSRAVSQLQLMEAAFYFLQGFSQALDQALTPSAHGCLEGDSSVN